MSCVKRWLFSVALFASAILASVPGGVLAQTQIDVSDSDSGIQKYPSTRAGVTVIKPAEMNRFDAISLPEWVFTSAGWAFTTYDNVVFQPAPRHHALLKSHGVDVYINGVQLQTDWLHNNLMHMLEFSPEIIDSVVVYPPGSFVRNRMTVSGALDIYFSEEHRVNVSGQLSNQVYDFGPLNQEGYEANIERVKEWSEVFINLGRNRYKTQILANVSEYKYSNLVYYDKEIYYHQPNRTRDFFRELGIYQLPISLMQLHQYETPGAFYRALTSLSYHANNVLWDDWLGTDIGARYHMYNVSASREASGAHGLDAGISYAFASSSPTRDHHVFTYDVDHRSLLVNAAYRFQLQNNAYMSVGFVSDNRRYQSYVDDEILESFEHYGTISYQRRLFQAEAALGTNRAGATLRWSDSNFFAALDYQHDTSNLISEVMPRLETGFGIRGPGGDATVQMLDPLELQFVSQTLGYSGRTSIFSHYGITLSHTWYRKLPHRETRFRHPVPGEIGYPLISDLTYRLLEDVGRLQMSGTLRSSWQQWSFYTSVNISAFTWGDELYQKETDRYPSLVFRQYLRYDLHPTFNLKASYHYEGGRMFHEFVSADPLLNLWPPAETREIHNLSLAFEQTMFRDRLVLTLILRNLLSSTETYQPNGLFYNMNMIVGMRVRF